jgi:hypothetical protein
MTDMSLDQIRDWHAKRLGWQQYGTKAPYWTRGPEIETRHPVPATLDAIAGLMPPGWDWQRNHVDWIAGKRGGARRTVWRMASTPDTGDELTDRARLAWLAWEAEAKGAAQ